MVVRKVYSSAVKLHPGPKAGEFHGAGRVHSFSPIAPAVFESPTLEIVVSGSGQDFLEIECHDGAASLSAELVHEFAAGGVPGYRIVYREDERRACATSGDSYSAPRPAPPASSPSAAPGSAGDPASAGTAGSPFLYPPGTDPRFRWTLIHEDMAIHRRCAGKDRPAPLSIASAAEWLTLSDRDRREFTDMCRVYGWRSGTTSTGAIYLEFQD